MLFRRGVIEGKIDETGNAQVINGDAIKYSFIPSIRIDGQIHENVATEKFLDSFIKPWRMVRQGIRKVFSGPFKVALAGSAPFFFYYRSGIRKSRNLLDKMKPSPTFLQKNTRTSSSRNTSQRQRFDGHNSQHGNHVMLKQLRMATCVACLPFLALLAACSDDQPEQAAKKEPYHPIFNPSPEQIAQRKAEEEARLPLINQLPALPKADRSEYIDMMEPLMPLRVYIANRRWEETPKRVADDIGNLSIGNLGNLSTRRSLGIPPELIEMTEKYAMEQNAFDKADFAKVISGVAQEQANALDGKRLVKVELNTDMAPLMPFDLNARSFKVDSTLFTDKTSYTREERDAMDRARRVLIPLKSYIFSTPGAYYYGFTGASALENIQVDDENFARKIEAARQDARLIVYGYVARVQRKHNKGTPVDHPYTFIQPHFADIVSSSGEILHTVEF